MLKKAEKVLALTADSGERVGCYRQQSGDMVYPRYRRQACINTKRDSPEKTALFQNGLLRDCMRSKGRNKVWKPEEPVDPQKGILLRREGQRGEGAVLCLT